MLKVSDVAARRFDAALMAVPVHVSVPNLETPCCLQMLSSPCLIHSHAHLQINFSKRSLAVLHRGAAGKHKAEHLLSFARLQPAHAPTDETQPGPGALSQIPNAELMGVDGGGVTVSASVSVQLSAAVGGFGPAWFSRQNAKTKVA